MQKTTHSVLHVVVDVLFIIVLILAIGTAFKGPSKNDPVVGSEQSAGYVKAATSTQVTITTASTFLTATDTARVYGRIASPAGSVTCQLNLGGPATVSSGIMIATGTVYLITSGDDNVYRGAINCLSNAGASIPVYFYSHD